MTPQLTTLRIDHTAGDPVAGLILNRPEKLNALSAQLLTEISIATRWLDETTEIKVVVMRGEGKAFSAGFDLDDFAKTSAERSSHDTGDLGRVAAEALTNTRPVTIAAIHGYCVGGGLVLAASCDLRLAAESATFIIPEIDLGIPLAWGGIPRLTREIGPAATKELVMTCRPFGAIEAHQLRFLNRVVPEDELFTAAETLAGELAAKPAFGLSATKQHVNAVMDEIAGVGRNFTDAHTLTVAITDDESRAAMKAYLNARKR